MALASICALLSACGNSNNGNPPGAVSGGTVTITATEYGFSPINPGAIGQLNLTVPTATGNYTYFCPIDSHRALGMTGTMVVGAAAAVDGGKGPGTGIGTGTGTGTGPGGY